MPSTTYRAHGWTAHEFRIMLISSRDSIIPKIHCTDCGKVYIMLPNLAYLPTTLCARCYERPCHAGH